ncbi:MAG TPA: hypothetical protein VHE35_21030 [Kofleriaceae bacterium]|nr:hypothetical protein [Kofleriaceae bacterium]
MQWLLAFTIPCAVLAMRPGVPMSRRVLALALVLFVPLAGPVLAWIVRSSRGGTIAVEPPTPRQRSRASVDDVRRLAETPSVVERLLSRDSAERLAALVHLSSVGDANARAVLQWTIEHGPTEVVLEAALTLEELELRGAPRKLPTPPTLAPAAAPVVTVPTVPSRVTIPALGALAPRAA